MEMGSQERATKGFILQAIGPGGERRWWVKRAAGDTKKPNATMGELLRETVAEIDALPGQWKVETISTPETVYRDLQGSRGELAPRNLRRNGYGEPLVSEHLALPEPQMLGLIGRLDLLAS